MDIQTTLKNLIESGMTQAEIGAAVGRDQSTISDMINKSAGLKNPSYAFVTNLQKLAELKLKNQINTLNTEPH